MTAWSTGKRSSSVSTGTSVDAPDTTRSSTRWLPPVRWLPIGRRDDAAEVFPRAGRVPGVAGGSDPDQEDRVASLRGGGGGEETGSGTGGHVRERGRPRHAGRDRNRWRSQPDRCLSRSVSSEPGREVRRGDREPDSP